MTDQRDPLIPAGMEPCGHCNGYGSSLKETSDRCSRCGGTGLVACREGRGPERGDSEQHPLKPPE